MGDGEDAKPKHDPLRPALPRSPAYRQYRGKGRGHQERRGNHEVPPEQESLEHSQGAKHGQQGEHALKAAF